VAVEIISKPPVVTFLSVSMVGEFLEHFSVPFFSLLADNPLNSNNSSVTTVLCFRSTGFFFFPMSCKDSEELSLSPELRNKSHGTALLKFPLVFPKNNVYESGFPSLGGGASF